MKMFPGVDQSSSEPNPVCHEERRKSGKEYETPCQPTRRSRMDAPSVFHLCTSVAKINFRVACVFRLPSVAPQSGAKEGGYPPIPNHEKNDFFGQTVFNVSLAAATSLNTKSSSLFERTQCPEECFSQTSTQTCDVAASEYSA